MTDLEFEELLKNTPTRDEREANIKALKQVAAVAWTVYDRASRHIGANEVECGEAWGKWRAAQDAVEAATK